MIKIDPEFKSLISSLSEEEKLNLEKSLLKEGCRNALIIWKGNLLDGHHRYEICQKHKIKFETKEINFKDREEAKIWIIKNQFARRNLTPFLRAELALKLESIITKQAEKRILAGKKIDPMEILPQGKTRDQLGKIAGVSGKTIDIVKKIIQKGSEEQKENLRKNSEKIFHVASEIKDKEKREKHDRQAEEQRKQRENATLGENGWKFQFYRDKWGNKWVHETKGGEDLIKGSAKDKDAHSWRDRIVKYNPEYKKAYDDQADFKLSWLFNDLNFKLEEVTKILNQLKKKHDLKEIKKAYTFDEDRPREGWDNWGNEGGLELQPGNPPPINIEKNKRFLWPEIVSLYEKIQQSWDSLQQ